MQRYVVVADAARARIFSYEFTYEADGPHERLHEEYDLVDPEYQERSSDVCSDRSGTNHVGVHGYALDDHRQHHRDNVREEFARQVGDQLAEIFRTRGPRDLIVIANSRMLGELRKHVVPVAKTGVVIDELERDLTKFTSHELRGRLAELGLLPPRIAPTLATQ